MVTEWALRAFASFVSTVFGWVEVPEPPSWIGDIGGYLSTVGAYFDGTGNWIPWALVAAVLAGWAGVLLFGLAVRFVRVVASFLTLGGGM